MKQRVSWPDKFGRRKFGSFVKWADDGHNYAVVKTQTGALGRIYKANLTFEMG